MTSNQKHTVLIVEDELHSRAFIRNIVLRYSDKLDIVGEAQSIVEAVELINQKQPNILLLDIQLKDGLSFKIFDQVKDVKFQSIFVTSYDHYAIKAIKLSAIDYVLKPIHIPELLSSLDRAIEHLETDDINFTRLSGTINRDDTIVVPQNGTYNNIKFSDIFAFISENSYTRILLKDHSLISTKALTFYEDILPDSFVRCHRSSIVNTTKVETVEAGRGGTCVLTNGYEINVSVRRKADLMAAISSNS